jgi:hypothetical protein
MTPFTLVHTFISLVGIGSGVAVALGLLGGRRLERWTVLFLTTTIATSVTGFGFPFDHLLPAHVIGLVSIAVLAVAVIARYPMRLVGWWRPAYVISAMIALYFNVFVLIVQLFRKVPPLKALAPTQAEPPFLIVQSIALALFVILTILAVLRFHVSDWSERRASESGQQ